MGDQGTLRTDATRTDATADDRLLLESIPDWVWVAGAGGGCEFLAAQALRTLGLTRAEAQGDGWQRVIHPEDGARVAAAWGEAVAEGRHFRMEYRVTLADGSSRWYLAQGLPQFEPSGAIGRWVGTWTDIDDLKRAELESVRRAVLLASVRDAVIVTDDAGLVTYWNEGATRLFGWEAAELMGRPLIERVPEEHREEFRSTLEQIVSGAEFSGEWLDWRKDGTPVSIHATVSRIRDADGRVTGVLGVSHDITARKSAEAHREALLREAERSRHALADLSRRLIASAETERRRVAHELHDELGQVLTVVHLNLRSLRCEDPVSHDEQVAACLDVVSRAIEQVRALSLNLRPPSLDALGIDAAVSAACLRIAESTGIEVNVASSIQGARFSSEVETAAYRIAQEALTNLARHSGAKHAWVDMAIRNRRLEVVVEDDGCGFDPTRTAGGTSVGLASMKERAQLAGGDLEIDSVPGRGTTIRADMPCEEAQP